jgi:hypothetical protein
MKGAWPILVLIDDGPRGEYGMPFFADGTQGNKAAKIDWEASPEEITNA